MENNDAAEVTPENQPVEETPPLNRAERRALEHNKKSSNKPGSAGSGFGSARGAMPKANQAGPASVRYPRTGHK